MMNSPLSSPSLPRHRWSIAVAALALFLGLSTSAALAASHEAAPPGFLLRTNYHGWTDALWLSNGKVEAILVPQIARIMQFRLAGRDDGPFWENPELLGKPVTTGTGVWQDFGGDKIWPAPKTQWGDITPTNWPPPVGFDATPATAQVDGWVVTMTLPADPHYGIVVTRRVTLDVFEPAMHVLTTFEKTKGQTLDVAIWAVTQVKPPLAIYTRIPANGEFPQGFQLMSERRPPTIELHRGSILSLTAEAKTPHRIGLDVGTLIWMGPDYFMRVDSPRRLYAHYPDNGTSAQISINPDPAYMGLEMFGPITQMRIGQTIRRNTTYTLLPRQELDPMLEARRELPN